jgi:hypothetical protein
MKAKQKIDQRQYTAATPAERRGVVVSLANVRKRTEFIENLLVAGISPSRIARAAREQLGMKSSSVNTYIDRIRERWAEEERGSRPYYKQQAIRRIYGHISQARAEKNWSAIAQLEKLLADIQGTKEPITVQIDVDATVKEAALHVIANLTPERRQALIAEQRRLRELAAQNTITVPAEAPKSDDELGCLTPRNSGLGTTGSECVHRWGAANAARQPNAPRSVDS